MAERIFLHVGTPKSGTTYLQAVLWQNVDALKGDGVLLPGRFKSHYAAAKGVTSRSGMKRDLSVDVQKAWPRLARQMRQWDASALISHELFAPASAEQASRAKRRLGDAELHLVLTARSLSRQLPASWQEQVKSGLTTPFDAFLRRVRDGEAKGEWFWEVQDLADIADRWGVDIPPERIHVVTVPTTTDDPGELWRRYASVLGLQADAYDIDVPRKNVSLGPVETELLRLVHSVRDERFTDPGRHQWTRKLLASETLGRHPGAKLGLSPGVREWLDERTAAIEKAVVGRGYDVVGDLADLHWIEPPADARSSDSVGVDEVNALSKWVISQLQEELVQRQPVAPPPPVGPDDGPEGILELLEHIRAADTGSTPRKAPSRQASRTDRLRKSITALRGR